MTWNLLKKRQKEQRKLKIKILKKLRISILENLGFFYKVSIHASISSSGVTSLLGSTSGVNSIISELSTYVSGDMRFISSSTLSGIPEFVTKTVIFSSAAFFKKDSTQGGAWYHQVGIPKITLSYFDKSTSSCLIGRIVPLSVSFCPISITSWRFSGYGSTGSILQMSAPVFSAIRLAIDSVFPNSEK